MPRLIPSVILAASLASPALGQELYGQITSFNSRNDMVGMAFRLLDEPLSLGSLVRFDPVLWTNGERFILPSLGEGGQALSIDEAGIVRGTVVRDGEFVPVRWVNLQLQFESGEASPPGGGEAAGFALGAGAIPAPGAIALFGLLGLSRSRCRRAARPAGR